MDSPFEAVKFEQHPSPCRCREEEVLHSKPNLLYLAPDPLSSGGVVLFTAYYTDPTVDVFTYNVTVSRMEEAAVREHYPGVHRYDTISMSSISSIALFGYNVTTYTLAILGYTEMLPFSYPYLGIK